MDFTNIGINNSRATNKKEARKKDTTNNWYFTYYLLNCLFDLLFPKYLYKPKLDYAN